MIATTTIDKDSQERLKTIIKRLHAGESVSAVRKDFARLIEGVSAEEVAAMEQSLVDEGFPVEEIQRLCEVHVEVFKSSLEKGRRVDRMPGHPIHSFVAENRAAAPRIGRLLREARALAWGRGRVETARAALEDLSALVIHYQRKENQLFPWLEKHGFTGPSKVMWGKHDEIRVQLKVTGEALGAFEAAASSPGQGGARTLATRNFRSAARKLAGMMRRMFFMEERILFPNALSRLTEREWALLRQGEDAIGWAWIKPGAEYDAGLVLARTSTAPKLSELIAKADADLAASGAAAAQARPVDPASATPMEGIALDTGVLGADLLNLVLKKLPVDISVVDENDHVLYYSDNPDRLFPRSPAVIGRDVRNCHPHKSVAIVEKILAAFKDGSRDTARFWIEMGGKFVVIEYLALRDAEGRYRGTLEMTQDATGLRALEGQRRLLDWS
jgi:DUF438 domain-containing protein